MAKSKRSSLLRGAASSCPTTEPKLKHWRLRSYLPPTRAVAYGRVGEGIVFGVFASAAFLGLGSS